jgi:addiction module RelE/StbE family toxin
MWKVVYKKSVKKDLKGISRDVQYILQKAIEEKLMTDPIRFGLPLRRSLKRFMKLRVGDYRIIYSVERKTVTICVIKIGHRKEVSDK